MSIVRKTLKYIKSIYLNFLILNLCGYVETISYIFIQ